MPEQAKRPAGVAGRGKGGNGIGSNDSQYTPSTVNPSPVNEKPRFLAAALKYASAYGWPVHPLHEIRDGQCTCDLGTDCGNNAGKHPRVRWKDRETDEMIRETDPDAIRKWWKRWPTANIGSPTGDGIAVLDVDPRHGGDEELAALIDEHGPLPHTPQGLTGGGGQHYWFSIDEPLAGSDLAPGIELKADGEQVVLPPSMHPSGKRYEWEASSHPDDVPLAPLPDWLRTMAKNKQRDTEHDRSPGWFAEWLRTPIPGGGRRKPGGIPRAIGYLGRRGHSIEETVLILSQWDTWNSQQCKVEPLGETEIHKHVEDMYTKYDYTPYEPVRINLNRKHDAPQQPLRFQSAREIADQTPEAIDWLVKPWIVRGGITEFDGKVKAAGKTTLITALCHCALTGSPFLGEPTIKTPVVYLTEQPGASFREALRRANLLDHDDMSVLFWHEAVSYDWKDITAAAVEEAKRIGAELLVVDTLPPFAGIRGDSENDSGAAQAAMEPLQHAAAAYGLGIVIARHERKSGGDVGDSGRGSSAFAGAVDIIVAVRRGEGNTRDTVRVLNSLSRFDETPDSLTIEWTPTGYVSLGETAQVAQTEARTAILDDLPATEDAALTEQELLDSLPNVKRTTVRQVLRELVSAETVTRTGEGKRGSPYRYFLSDVLKAEEPSERNTHNHTEQTRFLSDGRGVVPSERNEGNNSLSFQNSESTGKKLSDGTSILRASERNNDDPDETPRGQCVDCGTPCGTAYRCSPCAVKAVQHA